MHKRQRTMMWQNVTISVRTTTTTIAEFIVVGWTFAIFSSMRERPRERVSEQWINNENVTHSSHCCLVESRERKRQRVKDLFTTIYRLVSCKLGFVNSVVRTTLPFNIYYSIHWWLLIKMCREYVCMPSTPSFFARTEWRLSASQTVSIFISRCVWFGNTRDGRRHMNGRKVQKLNTAAVAASSAASAAAAANNCCYP